VLSTQVKSFPALLRLSLIALVMVWVTACGSTRTAVDNKKNVEAGLMKAYAEWNGTPYRLGGTTPSGVDCSGLVQNIYTAEFNVQIPRSTGEQIKEGRKIRKSELQTGDLVFFKTGRRTMHVGIYMGSNRFLHSSTSNGVMISGLQENYWDKKFIEARRVF
jgi:cell wall-associated NlpC family hydrolase